MVKKTSKKKTKVAKRKAPPKIKHTKATDEAIRKARNVLKKSKTKRKTTKRRAKIGRPTVLTKDIVDRVSGLIMAGAYIETACAACGLAKKLYYEWLKLGEQRRQLAEQLETEKNSKVINDIKEKYRMIDPIYEQFSDAIQKAVVQAELRDLIRIDEAAVSNWHAAAWKLERKYPDRWGRKYRLDHSGEVDTKQTVNIQETRQQILSIMGDPQSLALAKELSERMRLNDGKDK